MPYVKIEMITGRSPEQKALVAKDVTDALVKHAKARPENVMVVFQDVAATDWAENGEMIGKPAGS